MNCTTYTKYRNDVRLHFGCLIAGLYWPSMYFYGIKTSLQKYAISQLFGIIITIVLKC